MRKMLWIAVSIFAASFASGANPQKIDWQIFAEPFVTSAHAQEVDWQRVDDALGRRCRQECGGNWRSAGSENLNIACQAARSIG
jgi:hypothetical protein